MSIRIGILGLAHGHVGMYCAQWAKMSAETVRLMAVWDHDGQRAAAGAKQCGFEIAPSAAALVARPDVDAVIIGAETSMHADLVEQAAAAGKAIVVQKPLALTMPQADRIVAAVEKAGVPFTVAWQMRVDPQNLRMKELVEAGTLGRIFQVRRRHCLPTHTWGDAFANSWHVKPELNRGMWADDAAHPIDWLLWMFGLPETVTAEIDTLHSPKVPDDTGIAIFRYAGGMMAEVTCSFTATAGENTVEITGERGVVIQNYGDLVSCAAPRVGGPGLKWILRDAKEWQISDIPSPTSQGERIGGLAVPLLEFLQGKRAPIATARQGRDALRLILASYRATELGRRIRIDEIQA